MRGVLLNPLRPPPRLPADLAAAPEVRWRSVAPLADDSDVVYHVMSPFEMGSPFETLLPPPGLGEGVRTAVTLYDLIPLTEPERYLPHRASATAYRARLSLVRAADAVLAISRHTAAEAAARLDIDPGRIHVIGGGAAPTFRPTEDMETTLAQVRRALPALVGSFVLSVTGSHDRKNTEGLLDAYVRLPKDLRKRLQLVIACDVAPPWEARWRDHARGVGLDDAEVVITGHVSDDLLLMLYQSARLFVFPSLSEGFGLPVVEAVASGCPTVTSNTTSIPEVLDWAESTFDPTSPEQMASVAERALTDDAFRAELRRIGDEAAARTTWDAVADRTLAAIDRLKPGPQRSPRPRRLRVALAGPFAPSLSGVAGYSGRLLGELAQRCQLDVFTEPGSDGRALRQTAHRVLPINRLGSSTDPASYDAIVYAIGNSVHHHATHDAALRHPGVLWLHDVRLHRLVVTWARARYGGEWRRVLDSMVNTQYGPRAPTDGPAEGDDEALYAWLATNDVFLTRHLIACSRGAVVHSHAARHLLELDQPASAWVPPIEVVPHAVPDPPWPSRTPTTRPLVVSMGILHPVKVPELLIRAVAQLDQPVDLALVGDVAPDYRAVLERLAQTEGLRGQLHMPGAATPADYWHWLQRAWGAVQLRTSWNGESSGAVHDAVAAGVPVATNVPSAAEIAAAGAATLLPGTVTATDVAVWLRLVLARPPGAAADGQERYAGAHSVADVATTLVDALSRLASQSGTPSTTRV